MKLLTYLQTNHGLSRRAITALIQQEAIKINDIPVAAFSATIAAGDILARPGHTVTISEQDQQTPDHKILLFHKPCGYVVSKADPHNTTIFDLLPAGRADSYYPVGRLDKDSSGLLILSTDPAMVNNLLHPSKKIEKVYVVIVKQERETEFTPLVLSGCLVNDHGERPGRGDQADLLSFTKINHKRLPEGPTRLTITLREGKKRHIRRLLRYLGFTIISLQRIAFGKRHLNDIPEGEWKEPS